MRDTRLDYLRVEGEGGHREWVLAEAQSPGYVSRIWSANPAGELHEPAPAVIHTGDVPLGMATLDAGTHALSIILKGKNARSTNYLVGMDWIKLTPASGASVPEPKR